MSYPIQAAQSRWFRRHLLSTTLWTALCCGGGGAVIQCFYGPGLPLSRLAEAYPIPMGLAAAGWLIASLTLIVCWLSRLAALLTWKKRLLKSMAPYLREPSSPADLELLEKDLRCRLFDTLDLWLGEDWVVVPGKAMARDAVVGVFYEQLSRKYLSSKVRIALIDEEGRRLYADAPQWLHPLAANYLSSIHPQCSDGDIRTYQAFLLREQQAGREVPDHRRLLLPVPPAPLGLSRWDHTPLLEHNQLRCDYERWLLAAYALYIEADYHFGSFRHAGGWERSTYQQERTLSVLAGLWEVHNKEELLDTVEHLRVTGQQLRDGWQLGRAAMVLGFGYIAGLLTRQELLTHSAPVAQAIQKTFSGWEELHNSYMVSFEQWAQGKRTKAWRRAAYKRLLKDPSSVLNTVPFHLELTSRYQEAVRLAEQEG